jgi:hypothetical protein
MNIEKTIMGNKIIRGFRMGDGFNTMANLLKKDWQELYYDAPYYWGVIDIEKRRIFTYTEGDTQLIECDNLDSLVREAESYINFLKEQKYSRAAYGEWEGIKGRIEAMIKGIPKLLYGITYIKLENGKWEVPRDQMNKIEYAILDNEEKARNYIAEWRDKNGN